MADLRTQCEFGPRQPGSEGHEQCRQWLVSRLSGLADDALQQQFTSSTPFGGPYQFHNIIAFFAGESSSDPLLLGAHWDTRPVADQDPDPANRDTPILGANDGGSGVAVLLELARLMDDRAPSRPVIIALFDAEDSGKSNVAGFRYEGFCIGSDYLAGHWPDAVPRPGEMILLDIVGTDRERNPRLQQAGRINGPQFLLEENSLNSNPLLLHEIWEIAEQRGHAAFVRQAAPPVVDDHKPFIDRGVPAVDIIHFVPAEWHTIDDTPEHCSAQTLYEVGDTLVDVIWD